MFLKRNCTLHNAIQSKHVGVGPGVGVGVGVGIKAPTPESESTPMKTLSTPQPCVPRAAAWTLSKTICAGHFFRTEHRRDLKLSGYVHPGMIQVPCKWWPPRGQNYALRARFHFQALCPLAPTPLNSELPNLVQGCVVYCPGYPGR